MPRHATPLTSVRIRNARPDEFPLYDSQGLYLVHTSTGSKRWRLKYTRPDGRENRMALGTLPDVSLAQARLARDQARALLRQAIDPVEQLRARKRDARRVTEANFPAAARAWLDKEETRAGSRDVSKGPLHRLQHESPRQLPRQCSGRELFPAAKARAREAKDLPDPCRGDQRCVRLHRDVLQLKTPAWFQRRPVPGRVRKATRGERLLGVYERRGDSRSLPKAAPSQPRLELSWRPPHVAGHAR